eukprot:CAMPEP_0198256880 /NCGR_PEP_ID=MMETSP1447-20131203/6686_1 /TAXON_ID=420782 /ORGANISM="Chaetoceros dichaeta, Strain CCMP1751" /LENGTH=158 /DNA_ID=CAMNT_0043943631 /DNA_START=47 /DNA_END=523 /DNA_ORIENTATION=+
MERIPLTTKVKVLELSNKYLQRKFNTLIRKYDTGEDSDILVKKYKKTWGGMRVAGAGVEAVNGVYSYTGCFNKVSIFSKRAMWNGHDEIFSIAYYADDQFWISVQKREKKCTIDFYRTQETNETEDTIDNAIWCVAGDGIEPAPTVVNVIEKGLNNTL